VSALKPRSFAYEVAVDRDGLISAEDDEYVDVGDEWTADHLLLAAVVRCSIASLRFHARRTGVDATAAGTATGTVTKPAGEERFRFVSIAATIDAELDPEPDPEALAGLLETAERDCFVGASLVTKPAYRWRVNGQTVRP